MSHFTVLVTKTNKTLLEEQLAPFDENIEVEPYDEECYCIRRLADQRAAEATGLKWSDLREKYHALPPDERPDWKEYTKPLRDAEKAERANKVADPECEECKGTGIVQSTYNPKSKWDWYSIGGRWAGYFVSKPGTVGEQGHHRAKDFASITGDEVEDLREEEVDIIPVQHIDWDAMTRREKERRATYYDREMAKEGDDRFVWADNREAILKMSRDEYLNQPTDQATFAVLHDGEWYERGEMGWWGMVSNEKANDDWSVEFKELIQGLSPETEVTVVDCHI